MCSTLSVSPARSALACASHVLRARRLLAAPGSGEHAGKAAPARLRCRYLRRGILEICRAQGWPVWCPASRRTLTLSPTTAAHLLRGEVVASSLGVVALVVAPLGAQGGARLCNPAARLPCRPLSGGLRPCRVVVARRAAHSTARRRLLRRRCRRCWGLTDDHMPGEDDGSLVCQHEVVAALRLVAHPGQQLVERREVEPGQPRQSRDLAEMLSRPHLGRISRQHLGRISAASRLHLGCISRAVAPPARSRLRPRLQPRAASGCLPAGAGRARRARGRGSPA